MPVGLNHAAAASHRGRVYVLGGYRGRSGLTEETAALYRYDPERTAGAACRRPRRPAARSPSASSATGSTRPAAPTRATARSTTLEIYDLRTRRWKRGPSMRVAREHLAGAVARRALLRARRPRRGPGQLRRRRGVRPRAPAAGCGCPAMRKPRGGIAAATVRGRIVVVGGEESAGTIREVELFDPGARRWRRLADLPTPRHGLGSARPRARLRDRGRRRARVRLHRRPRGTHDPLGGNRTAPPESSGVMRRPIAPRSALLEYIRGP